MAATNIVPDSVPVKIDEEFANSIATQPDRFWSKVKVGAPDSCWEWQAARDKRGYGKFSIGVSRNAVMLAHRVSFGMSNGYLPEAVCHQCDNPPCCNPAHLMPGDRIFNNHDMMSKGRGGQKRGRQTGERHHAAKLNAEKISEIRSAYAVGQGSQRQLAERYGVSQRSIAKAIRGLHVGFDDGKQAHT